MLGMSVAEWLTRMVSPRCAKLAGHMYPVQQFYLILQNLKTFIIQSVQNCDLTLGPAAAVQQILVIGDNKETVVLPAQMFLFSVWYWATCTLQLQETVVLEINTTKLPAHTSCADVNARGVLDLCSQWVSRAGDFYTRCSADSLQTRSVTLHGEPLKRIVEYLQWQKFHELTCCEWQPVRVPCWNMMSSVEQPIRSCKSSLLARCLILYTCGNRTENTWIHRLRGVVSHIPPYAPLFRKDGCSRWLCIFNRLADMFLYQMTFVMQPQRKLYPLTGSNCGSFTCTCHYWVPVIAPPFSSRDLFRAY